MSARVLIVDGFDMSTIGMIVSDDIRGFEDGPILQWPNVRIPHRIDALVTSSSPNYRDRVITVPATVLGSTRSEMQDFLDEIKWRLSPDQVLVRFAHDETREYRGRVDQGTVKTIPPAIIQRGLKFTIRIVCFDPRKYAISDTVQAFSGATSMALGTAPSHPVLRLSGGSNPIVIYKDSSAVEQGRMEFSWSGTWIDVNMLDKTIIDNTGANQADALTVGDFFVLDPRDGDYPTPSWPTLQVSSSSGQATYRKNYW
jgi:phage-related protein